MRRKSNDKKKKGRILAIGVVGLLLALVLGFYIYTLDYYRASETVDDWLTSTNLELTTTGAITTIMPKASNDLATGMIFYPGGKVEAAAYLPLLIQLAEEGLTCVLVEMPMNLAVFNVNAAEDLYADYPNIENWYLAGHSLGGAMASSYMEKHYDEVAGLILLGAYPLNEAPVRTLAIYGTYDVKLDLKQVQQADFVVEIVGGNHAYFGDYGEQEGDGQALITRAEQQFEAVRAIMSFIESK